MSRDVAALTESCRMELANGKGGHLLGNPLYDTGTHPPQSHGARPEDSVDPIVLGAQVVQALQTIPSRSLPPLEPSVVTVGIFRGGERFNIIPADVHLEGTVRTYSDAARATLERRMRQILDGLTAAGATYDLDYAGNAPATVNDPALFRRVRPWLEGPSAPPTAVEKRGGKPKNPTPTTPTTEQP